jgi:peptidyl-prolyl cis-trans isomerase SurA
VLLGGLAAMAMISTTPLLSQTVEDDSAQGLDLPKEIMIFGNSDPNIRKATAIVNGTIITGTDVDHRLALALANGAEIPAEEKERLRLQVLRNLIDETLEIQEAAAQKIDVPQAEIDQTFARVGSQVKRSPAEFAKFLKTIGSSEASLKRQIEGEMAWKRVLGRRVEPFVNVSEEEVNAIIARLNASKGAPEYHIGEIFLSATPEAMPEAEQNAQRIIEQLRRGGSFAAYARQFSESSSAAVGGDLGWVKAEQIPDQLATAAKAMTPGQVSAPIAIPGGYSIIVLVDKRQVLTADARDAVLALKQISIAFPEGTTQTQAAPKVEAFAKAVSAIQGCGKVAEVAASIGAAVVDNDQVKVRDLPPQLQELLINAQVGQATRPFGSLNDGVRSLVLCGRDDAAVSSDPSFDQISSQLEEERVNRRARRYLRDLRRDAVIEYR